MRDGSSRILTSPPPPTQSFPRAAASTNNSSSSRLPLSHAMSNAPRQSLSRRLSASTPQDKENRHEGLAFLTSPKDTLSLGSGKKSDVGEFVKHPSLRKSLKTDMTAGMPRLFLSPGSQEIWGKNHEEAKEAPASNKSSTSFRSGKAFWLNLMEEPQSPQYSEGNNAYTPVGRMIQKTWTSGSPLSDASAYEIDNVDQLWQHHLEFIHTELELVNQEVYIQEGRLDSTIQTTSENEGNIDDSSMSTVPQARCTTELHSKEPGARASLAVKYELMSRESTSRPQGTGQTVVGTHSPLSAVSPLGAHAQSNANKNTTDLFSVGGQEPNSKFALARKSIGFAKEDLFSLVSPTSSSVRLVAPLGTNKMIDLPEEEVRQPESQFAWARNSLGFAKDELHSTLSPTSHSLRSLTLNSKKKTTDLPEEEEAKPESQFEWARKSLGFSNGEALLSLVSPPARSRRSVEPNTDLAREDGRKPESQFEWARKSLNLGKPKEERDSDAYCLSTPKNQSTTEKPVSQFEWARQSLDLAQKSQTIKAPQTAPPKSRPFSNSMVISKVSDSVTEAEEGHGFKSLLKAWKTVDNDKGPAPAFLSPAATHKASSRNAATTTKLPPPVSIVSAKAFITAAESTKKEEDEDAERDRLTRMVQSFQGYDLRQKPEKSVLAMGRKFANRYVDSDIYESTFAKGGEPNRALVILENNDTFQILLGGSKSKGTTGEENGELKIRNVELVHSNHIDLALVMCDCSGSVFSGNDDLISFFLPQMGMACTCGKRKPHGFVNPSDPTALENVLRPWQVSFLDTFGITRSDQLVKARRRSSYILARGLKQWRRKQDMVEFKTSSCAMAIDIWSKTAKVYARSIRKQIDAGHELLERQPDEVMKELARFVGDLPAAPRRRGDFAPLEFEPDSEMEV